MISDGRSSLGGALKAVDQTSAFPSALKRAALGRGETLIDRKTLSFFNFPHLVLN